MNKHYRYYQCSNNRPYENHGRKCAALLIRADALENMVWEKTRDVLSRPGVVLEKITQLNEDADPESLDKEIKDLEKNMHNYEKRRINLLEAMELGIFGRDEILDRLNKIKHARHEDEIKLNDLLNTREHLTSLANSKIKLSELYDQVMHNLENSTPEIKALALDALDIKVYASGTNDLKIQGVIPLELALSTTEQTSA